MERNKCLSLTIFRLYRHSIKTNKVASFSLIQQAIFSITANLSVKMFLVNLYLNNWCFKNAVQLQAVLVSCHVRKPGPGRTDEARN